MMATMGGEDPQVGGLERSTDDAHIRTFLIADVRGYTLFTQERGDEAAGKLAAKFARIAREVVEGRGGTLLELRGDEALCVFGSTRQAIRAGVDLQERFVEETLADPELPLTVGIGLDAGEAVQVEGGYRGGALNLAARLCGQARAGEVLASREVTHLARRVEGVRYEDRGSLSLKGLSEPVAFVRVVSESLDAVERLRPFAPIRPPEPRRRRLPPWPALAAAALAVVLITAGLPLLLSDGDPIDIGSNSIASIDAVDGSLAFATELGQRPGASAIGFGSLWVAQPDRGVVARLSLEDGSVIDPSIRVGTSPGGVAVGEGSVWVTNAGDGTVSRIDVETNEVSRELDAGAGPSGIAVGDGALWVADAIRGELLRIDLTSGDTEPVPMSGQPSGVAYTPDAVWVSVAPAGISRVDPADLTRDVHGRCGRRADGGPAGVRLDLGDEPARRHGLAARAFHRPGAHGDPGGRGPELARAGGGKIWVANEFAGSVTAIDPTTNDRRAGSSRSTARSRRSRLTAIDYGSPSGHPRREHRGGTLEVSSSLNVPRHRWTRPSRTTPSPGRSWCSRATDSWGIGRSGGARRRDPRAGPRRGAAAGLPRRTDLPVRAPRRHPLLDRASRCAPRTSGTGWSERSL